MPQSSQNPCVPTNPTSITPPGTGITVSRRRGSYTPLLHPMQCNAGAAHPCHSSQTQRPFEDRETPSMPTVVHVTHEAIQKIGGIGAVLQGLLTSPIYLEEARRNILVGPFWPTDTTGEQRLGPQGEV